MTGKWIKSVVFTCIGVSQVMAQGFEACPTIDLRDKVGVKISQGKVDWCYAVSVSHLLTVKFGEKASFAHLAMLYNDQRRKVSYISGQVKLESEMQKGSVDELLNLVKEQGYYCKGEQRSEFDLKKTMDNIERIYSQYQTQGAVENCTDHGEAIGDWLDLLFPNVNMEQLVEICKVSNAGNFLDNVAKHSCDKVYFDSMDIKTISTLKEASIAQQLALGQVVSIAFAGELLDDPRYGRRNSTHASTIVGQRYNARKNRCEYLLHDSVDALLYHDEWQSDQGLLWLAKESLLNVSTDIYYLE